MPFVRIGEHFRERASEWFVTGMLFSWGWQALSASPDVWNLVINDPLRNLAPQWAWAAAAISIAVIRFAALWINGAVQRSPHARAIGAFLSCFLWLQLSIGYVTSGVDHPIAYAFYPWLFIADFYNAQRAARDAGMIDRIVGAGKRCPDAAKP